LKTVLLCIIPVDNHNHGFTLSYDIIAKQIMLYKMEPVVEVVV